MNYIRKADLYKIVARLKNEWGFETNRYRIDFVALCKQHGIKIGFVAFTTPGLRGIASLNEAVDNDVIILNASRNKTEQNIDCAHEFIHINCHRNTGQQSFNCFETSQPTQDKYLEWQANEGGAELIVPYQTLLPKIKKYNHVLKTYDDISIFKEELVQEYCVTDAVITYRLESLKYEIYQYINGIAIPDLRILSYTSQLKLGINIKSLNQISNEDLMYKMEK